MQVANGAIALPSVFPPPSSRRCSSRRATTSRSASPTLGNLPWRAARAEELLKRLRAFRGRLPADFKFDRDEANAR